MARFPSFLSSVRSSPIALPGLALILVAACSGAKPNGTGGGGGGGGGGGDGGGGGSTTPHALGSILLAESHAPTGGTSTPVVLASFLPDSTALPQTCATQVGGCSFVSTPQCGGSGSSCGENEACTWDSACNATCTASCSLQCSTGQECYFASPNQPACRQTETFDAGALAFAGTTTPITLFPPYEYQGNGSGAPFLAGAQLEVQASGSAGAGFDKFDEKFTATTFLQTNPPLDQISAADVFGTGAIPVSWAPGSDTINIVVSGLGGTATCTATDSSGSFQVPRAAVTAAMGKGGTSALTITVTREHDDWFKNETTHGTLSTATVQPVGWLEVSTASTETASFQGCNVAGETMCPDGCFDLASDEYHCGSCTTVCGSDETCGGGQCSGGTGTDCTSCQDTADTGTCAAPLTTCDDDAECSEYSSCITACTAGDTTCVASCESEYPTGYDDYESYRDCICDTACPSQCASACAAGQ